MSPTPNIINEQKSKKKKKEILDIGIDQPL